MPGCVAVPQAVLLAARRPSRRSVSRDEKTTRRASGLKCVRFAAAVEVICLERPSPALDRLDSAISRLTALGHTEETEPLISSAQLRDEG